MAPTSNTKGGWVRSDFDRTQLPWDGYLVVSPNP